jgi:DNA-binding NtrC family response regulator
MLRATPPVLREPLPHAGSRLGYARLGGTVSDSNPKGDARPTRAVPYLVVALECDRPTAGGARYALDAVDCVVIGRGEARAAVRQEARGTTTLDVRVPASAMSASHARLLRAGNDWILEDTGSTNGSYVNGERVTRASVGEKDVITLGRTILLLTPGKLTPSGAPGDRDLDGATQPGHVTLDPELEVQLEALDRMARSTITVLIRGETGTGKEVLARMVHEASGRPGAFVAVNCGAIPAGLVESHLFGHVKGAFSGAIRDEVGLFRAADGGTLFLDEVGDLPSPSQAALLRALQEREVLPVGGARPVKVDLRVLAATHQPLEAMASRGQFRLDLLARLTGFPLELPPLRARRMDTGVLVASLLRRLAPERAASVRFTPAAAEALFRYEWPLNTRELEQCLARALVLAGEGAIDAAHLPSNVSESKSEPPPPSANGLSERDRTLRAELLEQLARHRGNLVEVAKAMGKARMQVHRWCKRFGVDPNVYRG